MTTVVVTGIAGSLGRRVAARLQDLERPTVTRGIDVRAEGDVAPGVSVTALDLSAPDLGDGVLEAVMSGAEVVVHLAWRTGDGPGEDPDPSAANGRALERVLTAVEAAGVRRLVHLSSATVYGAWPDNPVPLTEDAVLRPNPGFAFAAGKAEAERRIAEWAASHPATVVVVLRPTVTLGTPERPLYQALAATRLPGAGDGARPVQYLHVDDLAAAVVLAAVGPLSGVYNVAPDPGVRESTARALSGGLATFSVPARLGRPLAGLGWGLWRRGVPVEAVPYTVHPWVVAADRLRAAGWVPAHSSEEALVATDDRPHLDDLPPGKRQQLTLLAGVGSVAAAAATIGGGVVLARRRLGRR